LLAGADRRKKPGPTKEDRGFLGKDNAKGIGEANPIRVTKTLGECRGFFAKGQRAS
jgi:hypothetical protein